jgi:site-specific DNA recombinase
MKVAIYARYSSDNQRDASIADQLRICREFAGRQAWAVVQEFTDHAISGATLLRSGFQALMRDALNRRFDVVLAESLDRFSRDQEDTAMRACPSSRSHGACASAAPSWLTTVRPE